MSEEKFTSVWDALEDTPAAADNTKVRSTLMMALTSHIECAGWTQAQAALEFLVTQPRLSDLQRRKIALFSVGTLISVTAHASKRIALRIREAA